jgi:hypothetical protein
MEGFRRKEKHPAKRNFIEDDVGLDGVVDEREALDHADLGLDAEEVKTGTLALELPGLVDLLTFDIGTDPVAGYVPHTRIGSALAEARVREICESRR